MGRRPGPGQRDLFQDTEVETGVLYLDENLSLLRQFPDASIDLVYLDPPSSLTATTKSSGAKRRRCVPSMTAGKAA